MSDRSVAPPDALYEDLCAWCGEPIFGYNGNWHLLDGTSECLTADLSPHVSDLELDAESCLHLDDCEIIDGDVYCTECGEVLGDLE